MALFLSYTQQSINVQFYCCWKIYICILYGGIQVYFLPQKKE